MWTTMKLGHHQALGTLFNWE